MSRKAKPETNDAARSQAEPSPNTASSRDHRRHLRVVQTEGGGPSLRLEAPLFDRPSANRVAAEAANAAFERLRKAADLKQVLELTEALLEQCSTLTNQLASNSKVPLESTAGCDHCCHQPVGVTVPEALRVFAYLQQNRSAEELNDLRLELRKRSDAIRGLSPNDRYSPDHPCPP